MAGDYIPGRKQAVQSVVVDDARRLLKERLERRATAVDPRAARELDADIRKTARFLIACGQPVADVMAMGVPEDLLA